MSENLKIVLTKLDFLSRMKSDLVHSLGKIGAPLAKIGSGSTDDLSPDERETISAFTTRFATYQEQLGKTMRGIAVEEESQTSPFGAILALMEKLGILDEAETWKDVRELRNQVNHEYENDPVKLFNVLDGLVKNAPFLFRIHEKMESFVRQTYMPADEIDPQNKLRLK
jgi:hypothetical protein